MPVAIAMMVLLSLMTKPIISFLRNRHGEEWHPKHEKKEKRLIGKKYCQVMNLRIYFQRQ